MKNWTPRWMVIALVWLGLGCGAEADRSRPAPGAVAAAGDPWVAEPQVRPEVSGIHGAVVGGHPLAAAAGYEVLRSGGNAADAAVTMAAVLAVVRPHMNGVGGDAFALFYEGATQRVTALNASGRAAQGMDLALFQAQGIERMPMSGPLSITVPGAVSAWAATLERYGTRSLAQALAPAIQLAEEGFVVTYTLGEDLEDALRLNPAGQELYAPGGVPLPAGSILRNPALGRTLRTLATQGPSALYGGSVGAALARFLEGEGSPIRLEDLAAHRAEWTDPISLEFMGRTVHTTAPNSQGMVLLQTLAMIEARGLESARGALDPELLHAMVEAKKLSFADRDRWVADPAVAPAPLDRLLDRDYLGARAGTIGLSAMESAAPGFGDLVGSEEAASGDGDTVYLMVVDRDGNAVTWIQSLFSSFGSRLVDGETGIVLQNRGGGFTLEAGHPNQVAPGKRPFHTLMATLLTDADGRFEMAVGTPGGHGQPQTVAQGIIQILRFGMSPQHAAEAPRTLSNAGLSLSVESRMGPQVLAALSAKGHDLTVIPGWTAAFGNLQVILRTPNGVLRTGADMRREAAAMAW
jgi:gamma-glutamyltranspeptidase / glutathione hydrolase